MKLYILLAVLALSCGCLGDDPFTSDSFEPQAFLVADDLVLNGCEQGCGEELIIRNQGLLDLSVSQIEIEAEREGIFLFTARDEQYQNQAFELAPGESLSLYVEATPSPDPDRVILWLSSNDPRGEVPVFVSLDPGWSKTQLAYQ